jgi:hypothetical protein
MEFILTLISYFALWILILATPSWAQQPNLEDYQLSKTSKEVGGFQMRVEWKEKYTLGEKICLKITITNISDKNLPFDSRKWGDEIRISLTDGKGERVRMTEYGTRMLDPDPISMMGVHGTDWHPGQLGEWTRNLASYYVIQKPGRYVATIARWLRTAPSPPYNVVVRDIPIVVVDKRGQTVNEQPEKQEPEEEKPKSLPSQAQRMEEATDWLLPGLIVAGVILAGLVLFLLLRRKRS